MTRVWDINENYYLGFFISTKEEKFQFLFWLFFVSLSPKGLSLN